MARTELEKSWLVKGIDSGLDAALDRVARDHGMTAIRGGDGLEMRGGSQLKMRLLGGLFTKDAVLPRQGTIRRALEPTDPGVERIVLHLEDRMGVGFMDPGMKKKYDRILASVAFSVGAAITEHAAQTRDAVDPGAVWSEPSSHGTSASTADELERLAQLRERGLEDGFTAAKQKHLSHGDSAVEPRPPTDF